MNDNMEKNDELKSKDVSLAAINNLYPEKQPVL